MTRHAASRLARFAAMMLAALLPLSGTAGAQALRCSSFLHMSDGGWRSLQEGPVFGPSGTMHINTGELLHATDKGPRGEIARALNSLCEEP